MRAVPIDASEVSPGMKHFVMGAPDGDLLGENGVGALDVMFFRDEGGTPHHVSKWVADEEDRARIANGEPIWLMVLCPLGHHAPVAMTMDRP